MRSRRSPGGAGHRCGRAGNQCGGAGFRRHRVDQDMLTPAAGAAPVHATAAGLYPILVGPVSDVIALIQDMLTSVAGAVVPLTQLQSDLFSFLLGIAGVR